MAASSFHQQLVMRDLGAVLVKMYRARQARVKRVNGADDLERLFGIVHGRADERGLIGGTLSLRVPRRGIPRARYHELVVLDFAILDHDPVCKGAPRCLAGADAAAFGWPRGRLPQLLGEGA